jgi:hypothetical protein
MLEAKESVVEIKKNKLKQQLLKELYLNFMLFQPGTFIKHLVLHTQILESFAALVMQRK